MTRLANDSVRVWTLMINQRWMCKLHISFIDMQRQHSEINFERGISTKIYKEIVLYIYI